MRLSESNNETKGLVLISSDKASCPREIVRTRGAANAVVIITGNILEGIRGAWFDVLFASETNSISKLTEVVRKTLRGGARGSVIPSTTVAKWVATGVKFGAARATHCHSKISLLKN